MTEVLTQAELNQRGLDLDALLMTGEIISIKEQSRPVRKSTGLGSQLQVSIEKLYTIQWADVPV